MMKKSLFLVSALALLILTGCGKQNTTLPDMKTYETGGFTIQYPATRDYQEDVYGAKLMLFSPQATGDQFKENVGIITEALPSDMTVEEYYTAIKVQLTTLIPDYNEISNKDFKLNGIAAKKIVYAGTQQNYKLKWLQVFLIKNKTAYILNYTATADTFDEFTAEVDAIVNSFTLK